MNRVATEPLLSPETNRFVVFPIKHPQLWSLYKRAVASFWTVEEVSFLDTNEWNQLSDNEREFLETTLAFFAASDGLVNENLVARFYNDVTSAEARSFYTFQMAIESIHSECYSLLIDTYVKDAAKKARLFNALEENPVIREKGEWTMRWIESNDDFATRLIAFSIVEGVFFSSAFASIYFIKEKGILHSLTFTNELISRDEALHTEFAVTLYNMLENRLDERKVHSIFREAVDLESKFVKESLRCNLLGINAVLMIEYVKYVADRLLIQLKYAPLYHISTCPLDFMERISISNKSNFFEVRVAEYNKSTLGQENVSATLRFDEDF
jgi:ribonucleotide reductase beta subunit family protein with ferritin-like domain